MYSLEAASYRVTSFSFPSTVAFFFFPNSGELIAQINRGFAYRESRDAREKHLEAGNVLIEPDERSEGTEMVLIAQAFDHLVELRLGRLRLPQTIRANHRDEVLR